MIAMQTISDTEKSVQELAAKTGWWNTWSVRLVAMTVVVTALYFFAQWMTNRRGNELSKAQSNLIEAKDAQLNEDLKKKGEESKRIEREANQKIADTYSEAKRIETDAKSRIAKVEADSNEKIEAARNAADVKIAEASLRIAEANERTLATESRLEDERKTRLELEHWLAPRRVPQVIQDGHTVIPGADELKAMGTFNVIIETIADAEPRRLASQIWMALQHAGWNVQDVVVSDGMLQEGVIVEVGLSDSERSVAAFALAGFLTRLNIKTEYFSDAFTPSKVIKVKVGLKPDTYFLSEEQKREEEKRENILKPKVKPLRRSRP